MPSNGTPIDKTDDNMMSRLAAIGKMSAGIAHEIRNPLTSVKGFLQLLQREYSREYVDIAMGELDRAILVVQDLLQVSRPSLDNESYQVINLCSELESTLYLFQNQMYRVQVEKRFRDTEVQVLGKRNQLKQALFNLLKNAFEAIDGPGQITVEHFCDGKVVYVSIRDTGRGIPKEFLDLLGTPFFSTKEDGTGMGLAQVFSTIYQHGATIDVDSDEGQGTTFTIRYPISETRILGGEDLNPTYQEGQTFHEFHEANRALFYDQLEIAASNTFRFIRDNGLSEQPIWDAMDELLGQLLKGNRHELLTLGKAAGRQAAKNDYPLTYTLELVEEFRRVLWDFLYHYHRHVPLDVDGTFELERKINNPLDHYVGHYFASYADYKNEILRSHRDAIDDLSVPVIPLSSTIGILPLVGTIDTYRTKRIQEKTLLQIAGLKLQHIIIDVSAVAFLDTAVVSHLFRIIDGIALMGCQATITGIRPEIANTMVSLGISLNGKVETKGTLQQALESMNF